MFVSCMPVFMAIFEVLLLMLLLMHQVCRDCYLTRFLSSSGYLLLMKHIGEKSLQLIKYAFFCALDIHLPL